MQMTRKEQVLAIRLIKAKKGITYKEMAELAGIKQVCMLNAMSRNNAPRSSGLLKKVIEFYK